MLRDRSNEKRGELVRGIKKVKSMNDPKYRSERLNCLARKPKRDDWKRAADERDPMELELVGPERRD